MASKHPVRVRFAPSPTGFAHVGGIRTVLFNFLLARQTGGTFIVRVEDTDRERMVEGATEHLFKSLEWLGLTPDEGPGIGGDFGPYTQSERLDIYKSHAAQLVAAGALYPCWCSPERLDGLRKEAEAAKTAFKYDRHCLEHPGDPKLPHVLRFRVPTQPDSVSWQDKVFGEMTVQTAELDDFVCLKSDNFPTYHFANIVDDHLMQITHVLRAAEWLPSTPKHLLLYLAFGWTPPEFVHLPQILGPDGKRKLGKRDGAKDILDYQKEGYLVDALTNFLATLGWNDGSEQEIFSRQELIEKFSIERVQRSPAVFDAERLDWMNGLYIRELFKQDPDKLLAAMEPFWPKSASGSAREYKRGVLELEYERAKKLSDLSESTAFFFTDPMPDRDLIIGKLDTETAAAYLTATMDTLSSAEFTHDGLEQPLRSLAEKLGIKAGPLFMLIRVAITGQTATPGLFEMMALLGRQTILRRLNSALATLTD